MSGRGSTRMAARLRCAAALAALAPAPCLAQTAPPTQPPPDAAELDPNAPLAPLPDLGIAWPDLNAKDATETPAPSAAPSQASAAPADEGSSETRYAVAVEGLGAVGNSEDLLTAFRKQSALEADRKDPANAAQIGRRSRSDADLLTELLRSQGYYDAVVEPRTDRVAGGLQVVLTADPGQQYRFASVELPGLEAAGEDAAKVRNVLCVRA